ncbi:hypothetical protein EVAR_93382_1 [Eumeta japonica]|uniref:Uncharacterized protein n=1 Tax=Eumeta variegata TaxID=151549 RepID=A0A4C1UR29_EUMVA|nr:hypothetical protein EVAR_93382_1 [Eumeta japonica]
MTLSDIYTSAAPRFLLAQLDRALVRSRAYLGSLFRDRRIHIRDDFCSRLPSRFLRHTIDAIRTPSTVVRNLDQVVSSPYERSTHTATFGLRSPLQNLYFSVDNGSSNHVACPLTLKFPDPVINVGQSDFSADFLVTRFISIKPELGFFHRIILYVKYVVILHPHTRRYLAIASSPNFKRLNNKEYFGQLQHSLFSSRGACAARGWRAEGHFGANCYGAVLVYRDGRSPSKNMSSFAKPLGKRFAGGRRWRRFCATRERLWPSPVIESCTRNYARPLQCSASVMARGFDAEFRESIDSGFSRSTGPFTHNPKKILARPHVRARSGDRSRGTLRRSTYPLASLRLNEQENDKKVDCHHRYIDTRNPMRVTSVFLASCEEIEYLMGADRDNGGGEGIAGHRNSHALHESCKAPQTQVFRINFNLTPQCTPEKKGLDRQRDSEMLLKNSFFLLRWRSLKIFSMVAELESDRYNIKGPPPCRRRARATCELFTFDQRFMR